MTAKQRKRPIGKERLLNIMAARSCAFAFLRRAFIEEPTKEYLELLTESDVRDYFPLAEENDLFKDGYEGLSFFLREPDLLTDKMIGDLRAEYTSLFIGPGKLGAAPYESVYRSTKPLVFQEHTFEVRAEYAKHDFIAEKFQQEPDDHISLELDFLQRLTEQCMVELRAKRFNKAKKLLKDSQSFLREHLNTWAPLFAKKLSDKAASGFYRSIGKMLTGYLQVEEELIGSLLVEVEGHLKLAREKRLVRAV